MNQYSDPQGTSAVAPVPSAQNNEVERLYKLVSQLQNQIQRQGRSINRLESTLSEVKSNIRN